MTEIQRWHDKTPIVSELFKTMKNMTPQEIEKCSLYLYQIANDFWKKRRAKEECLSLTRDKLFNYYQAYQKRRWYDKYPSLRSAALVMSLMETDEMENVVHSFLKTLKREGLDKIYNQKKEILK